MWTSREATVCKIISKVHWRLIILPTDPSFRLPREEKLRSKENTCLAILGNDFFDALNVELVNPNHKTIYKQLKQQHPKVHAEHFKAAHSEVTEPKFANPYRLLKVSVRGNIIDEFAFTCVARNLKSQNIEQYFISPEYNQNGKIIRFVFTHNEKKELVLTAKAERSVPTAQNEHSHTKNPETTTARFPSLALAMTETSTEISSEDYTHEESEEDVDESLSW